ncbi:alpha/beta hydrolase [Pontibacter silvestris]|uniref:Alpha/beta hydrolase n=1 Tax=Pontibacter silvestris TaxID=2305183 RepID=A0ABW4X1D3_9BACT|nr:alpha/beta hydrolase-fold protein [Pontibacter silvestris]MCC9136054.1 alpha/beta hydrolase [Pontibacter silvestris]
MIKRTLQNSLVITFCCLLAFSAHSQESRNQQGTVERIKVHGKGLEGNLSGDSPDRNVSIYLPPSYKKDRKRRYPVVYLLHGFTDSDAKLYGFEPHWMNLPDVLNKAFTGDNVKEMIVVTPNAFTRFQGSMYSNSVTIGNWENFVAKELVAYIDSHYRTIPKATSRGLAGHSMGGYGAMRIGQKYPEIFSALYLLSPCCLAPDKNMPQDSAFIARLEAVQTPADLGKADFFTKILFASAAAWSPNPSKSPFFIDLPIENGKVQPFVMAKWTANRPLATIDQHIFNIRKLNAIAFDAGSEDKGIAASIQELDKILDNYGIKYFYEEYEGDHINRVAERIETKMVNFFSENLSFNQSRE